MKSIILVPPNGKFKVHDYSLYRIVKCLKRKDVNLTLVYIKDPYFTVDESLFDIVIVKQTVEEVMEFLHTSHYDKIFHRSWMHAYSFAAELVKEFDNVIVNIKDWNFAPKKVYISLFQDNKDHESIEYIFKNAELVLSHFTHEQSLLWAKEYETNVSKFLTFPEYCNMESFHEKPYLDYKDIRLVYAGAIPSSAYDEDYFPGKAHLRSVKKLTKKGIGIDFVLPEDVYTKVYRLKDSYKDFIDEDILNDKFYLVKGRALDATILDKYHFGFFELEATGVNHSLYKYAITSKFAFYLEAGLPMLVNNKFVSISKLIQKYKLGIVFDNKDLDNIIKVLDVSQTEYDTFVDNIYKYRSLFSYSTEKLEVLDI